MKGYRRKALPQRDAGRDAKYVTRCVLERRHVATFTRSSRGVWYWMLRDDRLRADRTPRMTSRYASGTFLQTVVAPHPGALA